VEQAEAGKGGDAVETDLRAALALGGDSMCLDPETQSDAVLREQIPEVCVTFGSTHVRTHACMHARI